MKVTIPVNVCIKRFYRTYVTVDENAEKHDVEEAAAIKIVDEQDDSLTLDPDLEIEAHDIVEIIPDYDGEMEADEGGADDGV